MSGARAWGPWIRQLHRWVSVAFTLAVIANFAAYAVAPQAEWVGLLAIPPLLLLLVTGLALFVLPYVRGRPARSG